MNPNKPLDGYSVQFATPCATSSYVREYVSAFHNTTCVLIELGATVDWAEFPGCADLALARAKIFGNFLRSSHTRLFMIDDDMSWHFNDVVRILLTKKDFVGAAGPKKTAKLEFAANNCSDEGVILPTEQEDGLALVTEVGAAFMALSKTAAQKMADAYPDLAFDGDDGVKEFAVYDPMIVGKTRKRRLSEDFAFCHRWRAIGGKIHLLPDVVLQHVGRSVWEGALIQNLMGKPIDDQKA
jgi:hypothetical protein